MFGFQHSIFCNYWCFDVFICHCIIFISRVYLCIPIGISMVYTDKKIIPKVANDVKLISGGKILENQKTVAQCRPPFGELPGGDITMHVIVQPSENSKTGKLFLVISCGLLPILNFSWIFIVSLRSCRICPFVRELNCLEYFIMLQICNLIFLCFLCFFFENLNLVSYPSMVHFFVSD